MRAYLKHLDIAGHCRKGSRGFFKRYGLDWNAFIEGGIDIEELRATGQANAMRVVEAAENDGRQE